MCNWLALWSCFSFSAGAADVDALLGSWEGGDRASMAIYGTLHVEEHRLSWGGHNPYHPRCEVGYTVEQEEDGTTFPDQLGKQFVIERDSTFATWLLKLDDAECRGSSAYLRLTFPDRNDHKRLALVEYGNGRAPVGMMSFYRPAE